MASRQLLRAARNASRAAAASASLASRSACAAAADAARAAGLRSDIVAALKPLESCCCCCQTQTKKKPRDDDAPAPSSFSYADYYFSDERKRLPDHAKYPTEKDLESDKATWAFYERWREAHSKEPCDRAEMARRFKLFRYNAKDVRHWNTHLPPDPKEAAIYIRKRKQVKSLISKGQSVSHFDECYRPMELGPNADGGHPFLTERDERLLKTIEEREAAAQDV